MPQIASCLPRTRGFTVEYPLQACNVTVSSPHAGVHRHPRAASRRPGCSTSIPSASSSATPNSRLHFCTSRASQPDSPGVVHFGEPFKLRKRSRAACSRAATTFEYFTAAPATCVGSFILTSEGSCDRIDFAIIRSSRARLSPNSIS
jgi:hypothetical protein